MFIIIGKTEAKVFDAREKLKDDIDNYAFDTITLIGESISKFNEASFDDGLFWEEEKSWPPFKYTLMCLQ